MRQRSLLLPYPLGLRNRSHEVHVTRSDSGRAILTRNQPLEDDRRAVVYRQWGMPERSPRQQPLPARTEPLTQRSQTILYHQVSELTRAELDGSATPSNNQPGAADPLPRTEPLGQPGEAPLTDVTVYGPSISVRLRR